MFKVEREGGTLLYIGLEVRERRRDIPLHGLRGERERERGRGIALHGLRGERERA